MFFSFPRVLEPFRRRPRTVIFAAGGFIVACLAAVALWAIFADRADPRSARLLETDGAAATAAATEARIKAFCGDCHAVPQPRSFPRDMWHDEVEKGYQFYAISGRTDLDPPPMGQTAAYFRSLARLSGSRTPYRRKPPLSSAFRSDRRS